MCVGYQIVEFHEIVTPTDTESGSGSFGGSGLGSTYIERVLTMPTGKRVVNVSHYASENAESFPESGAVDVSDRGDGGSARWVRVEDGGEKLRVSLHGVLSSSYGGPSGTRFYSQRITTTVICVNADQC